MLPSCQSLFFFPLHTSDVCHLVRDLECTFERAGLTTKVGSGSKMGYKNTWPQRRLGPFYVDQWVLEAHGAELKSRVGRLGWASKCQLFLRDQYTYTEESSQKDNSACTTVPHFSSLNHQICSSSESQTQSWLPYQKYARAMPSVTNTYSV